MGRNLGKAALTTMHTIPLGGISTSVFRSGTYYKGVGELVRRTLHSALSDAYPRNGAFSSVAGVSLPSDTYVGLAYGNGVFVAIAGPGASVISTNGVNWKTGTALPSIVSRNYTAITFANGLFVAIAGGGSGNTTWFATSPDGVNWTARQMPDGNWYAITYGGGVFVAVTVSSSKAASSPDGINWTLRALPSVQNWKSVTYGGGLFLALVGGGVTSTVSATSPDGFTWTARVMPGDFIWWGAAYGNGLFVACAATTGIFTSPDGINWTQRVAKAGPQVAVYGNGLFMAIGNDSSVCHVSFDGINWTTRTMATNGNYQNIAYGDGTFVGIIGIAGSTATAMYAENMTDSDYLYLSGTPGTFVRVK